jgi:hypothetical protein
VATRLATATQNAATNAVTALVDADVGAGSIQVRTGAQPASANNAATGTLLATFTLADPSFAAAAAGVAALDATPVLSTTGVAAGTAGWFRMLDNSGDTVLDGAVTVTGGGGEMELNTTTISIGVTVEITAGTFTTPAST